jgi:hypothetical protein
MRPFRSHLDEARTPARSPQNPTSVADFGRRYSHLSPANRKTLEGGAFRSLRTPQSKRTPLQAARWDRIQALLSHARGGVPESKSQAWRKSAREAHRREVERLMNPDRT